MRPFSCQKLSVFEHSQNSLLPGILKFLRYMHRKPHPLGCGGRHILGYLFQGRPAPLCQDTADSNDDGKIDISDAVYLLNYLFRGGSLPEPVSKKGFDPTVDGLDCYY